MAGGPMVNISIAFFLFWGVFATVGQSSTPRPSPSWTGWCPASCPPTRTGACAAPTS
ncbi:hypothetical protein [Nocardioides sp. B-3]|uniref:hypothetical protein n=1 Tax=Nocardioides sp. B-3 TaxID=2895565 RepID=UPI00300E0651